MSLPPGSGAACTYKHLSIEPWGTSESGKTWRWQVFNRHDRDLLGTIAWWPRWRCYVFHPAPTTTFHDGCLRDVADFLERATREQRAAVTP